MVRSLMVALAVAAAPIAHAAAPVALSLTNGFTFEAYSGDAPVGAGGVATNFKLFYIDEKLIDGFKSWYVFFDPARVQAVSATLQFALPIAAVYTTRGELLASAAFTSDTVSYAYRPATGLESDVDIVAWSPGGRSLELSWLASGPGDHIRVLTAVPEPASYAMLVAGLGVVGWLARRRSTA